jgi:hypothetical protein
MHSLIARLILEGYSTKACCCGHSKYSRTVIVEKKGKTFEFFSKKPMTRIKRFYKRDSEGVFYIPEVDQEKVFDPHLEGIKIELYPVKEPEWRSFS